MNSYNEERIQFQVDELHLIRLFLYQEDTKP